MPVTGTHYGIADAPLFNRHADLGHLAGKFQAQGETRSSPSAVNGAVENHQIGTV